MGTQSTWGAVQVQILGPHQGAWMAPRATTMAPTLARSTATGSKRRTSFLSLLLLPLCQALPQAAESQDWLAGSTCILDALAPGGVVDSQKFNGCMDCWRSSSDESLQTATTCLTSLPQFCKRTKVKMGRLVRFFVSSWTGRFRTWSGDGAPPQVSLEVESLLDLGSLWAPASVLQVLEQHSMLPQQICLLDWAWLLSQGKDRLRTAWWDGQYFRLSENELCLLFVMKL